MPHAPAELVCGYHARKLRAIFGYFFANERPLASSIRHRWKRNLGTNCETNCELQILSSWCNRSFKFVHRLGESAADQLRGHLEQGISDRHTQPCRAPDLNRVTTLTEWGTLSRSWSGVTTLTAVGKPCLGMHKLDNICSSSVYGLCVSLAPERNYKYCLVDATGVHRLGESAADSLRGHLEQGISDRHTLSRSWSGVKRLQWGSHALACTN